ncbi:MAG: LysR family transcriptional regulator [Monoglobales bacterium]|jgi:DNA-binding transcriptional LysR family regulator
MNTEMEYVYTVYQERNFTKAAERLYITQPALSIAIQKIEQKIGMPLFDRSTRPLSLTAAGEAYIGLIQETENLEMDFQCRIHDFKELNCGIIRMGGSHYLNAYILPDVLSEFMKKYPGIQVDLVEASSAQLSEMLSARKVDLTFNCNRELIEKFERYPAFQDNILLAVPEQFSVNQRLEGKALRASDIIKKVHLHENCPRVSIEQFSDVDFILLQPGNNLYDRTKIMFQNAGMKPKIKMLVSQLVTAYHLADSGIGAAFISDLLVTRKEDRLLYYKLDSDLFHRLFYILLPSRRYVSHAVKGFMQFFSGWFHTEEGKFPENR